jgi:hypothetical protein
VKPQRKKRARNDGSWPGAVDGEGEEEELKEGINNPSVDQKASLAYMDVGLNMM